MRLRGRLKEGWDSGDSPTPPRKGWTSPSVSWCNRAIPPRGIEGRRPHSAVRAPLWGHGGLGYKPPSSGPPRLLDSSLPGRLLEKPPVSSPDERRQQRPGEDYCPRCLKVLLPHFFTCDDAYRKYNILWYAVVNWREFVRLTQTWWRNILHFLYGIYVLQNKIQKLWGRWLRQRSDPLQENLLWRAVSCQPPPVVPVR